MPGLMANNAHGHSTEAHSHFDGMDEPRRIPNRLILCFDGTGNTFLGNTGDTNIVKLYNKFDRSATHQMHYYQPGIGTYTADGSSMSTGWIGKIKQSISQAIDQGVASTFDSHVIAGYRFLMRYYGPGDRIYIFGFSRGAYTARFLARMVSKVGLLSMGNEEMVPFAYKIYQNVEMHVDQAETYITKFKSTFCRDEHNSNEEHDEDEVGIKVHFLGLFDTVSSVAAFDVPFAKQIEPQVVSGTAEHVRHAIAIDERRVKFKAALFQQDAMKHPDEDIQEVWFAGNHGDVGGGWPAVSPEASSKAKPTLWQKLGSLIFSKKDLDPSKNDVKDDQFQPSDIALKWMIDELNKLGDEINGDQIQWDKNSVTKFHQGYKERYLNALKSSLHDTMKFGGGSGWGMVVFWNILEYLPFIKRWELERGTWMKVMFPLNKGDTRDIPIEAKFHHSVLERMNLQQDLKQEPKVPKYTPTNAVSVGPDPNDKAQPLIKLKSNLVKGKDGYYSVQINSYRD